MYQPADAGIRAGRTTAFKAEFADKFYRIFGQELAFALEAVFKMMVDTRLLGDKKIEWTGLGLPNGEHELDEALNFTIQWSDWTYNLETRTGSGWLVYAD